MHDLGMVVSLLESELPSVNKVVGLYLRSLHGFRIYKPMTRKSAVEEPGMGPWRSWVSILICKMKGMMVNFM